MAGLLGKIPRKNLQCGQPLMTVEIRTCYKKNNVFVIARFTMLSLNFAVPQKNSVSACTYLWKRNFMVLAKIYVPDILLKIV